MNPQTPNELIETITIRHNITREDIAIRVAKDMVHFLMFYTVVVSLYSTNTRNIILFLD